MRKLLKRAALQIPSIARLYHQRNELMASLTQATSEIDAVKAERARLSEELETQVFANDALHNESAGLATSLELMRAECEQRIVSARDRSRIAEAQVEKLTEELAGLAMRLFYDAPLVDVTGSPPSEVEREASTASARATADGPLVSLVCVTRNAERFVARALATMAAQSYSQIEILVQDSGSTDRTVEIVRQFAGANLVSESDRGALDGLLRAASRAKGEIIGVCWADDELLPHAVGWAISMFAEHKVGVIYGDQMVVYDDASIESIARGWEWNFDEFFKQKFFPPFSSSFFRRDALLGLLGHLTKFDHDEYEFWLWLSRQSSIKYVPGLVSKFHVHSGSRWTKPGHAAKMIPGRLRAIDHFIKTSTDKARLEGLRVEAETGTELWAALHEISCAASIENSLEHLIRVQDHFNGDLRYVVTIAHLLEHSKRQGMRSIDRIAMLAEELGYPLAVAANWRSTQAFRRKQRRPTNF